MSMTDSSACCSEFHELQRCHVQLNMLAAKPGPHLGGSESVRLLAVHRLRRALVLLMAQPAPCTLSRALEAFRWLLQPHDCGSSMHTWCDVGCDTEREWQVRLLTSHSWVLCVSGQMGREGLSLPNLLGASALQAWSGRPRQRLCIAGVRHGVGLQHLSRVH